MADPRTDWKENVIPNEDELLLKLAETLRDLQRVHNKKRGPGRALHRKSHAGVLAQVKVRENLPEPYRAGMFSEPKEYSGYVRYSNGSGELQHDKKGDVRGIALKVIGVPGKKIIPGMEDKSTQDFLAIKSAFTPFRTPSEFVGVVEAAAKPWKLPALALKLGPGRLVGILKQLSAGLSERVERLAALTFYSALPIRYGAYAAHYRMVPKSPATGACRGEGENRLREDLAARLREDSLTYEFQIQLYVDPVKTPIEDASVEWKEADSPYVTVADVVLPKQDLTSSRGKKIDDFVEALSFDPWHALVEHRPLGQMMRARNHAYRLSTQERGAAPEPDGSEAW
ncbi:MAG: catalase family protein [Polyangiaceae bacterium]|nr:catalase family protein [Polyangiaceae bacterium]